MSRSIETRVMSAWQALKHMEYSRVGVLIGEKISVDSHTHTSLSVADKLVFDSKHPGSSHGGNVLD